MEEHVNPNPEPQPNPKKARYKSPVFIITIFIITILAGYFGYRQWRNGFSLKNIFTQYKPLLPDSLMNQSDSLMFPISENDFIDTSHLVKDTVDTLPIDKLALQDTTLKPVIDSLEDVTISRLFKVNTTYDKIEAISDTLAAEKQTIKPPLSAKQGLFEELLLPQHLDQTLETSFNKYSQENIISSKSVLKLLSITGKSILLGDNITDSQSILETLTESEKVDGILVVDRNGKVVYATNRKYLEVSIKYILPKIDLHLTTLTWYQEGNQNIASLPIFHTYGKIGLVVLITKQKPI